MSLKRLMLPLAVVAVFAGLCWWTYQTQFGEPMAGLREDIETLREREVAVARYLRDTKDQAGQLEALRQRSLGTNAEAVVHELRVVLRAVGERAGLQGVTVDSRPGRGMANPAVGTINQPLFRRMRDTADFVPVTGSLRATGSYESAMTALAMLTGSDRLLRVDEVRFTPVSAEARQTLDVRIEVTTIFAPGHGPTGGSEGSDWLASMLSLDAAKRDRVAQVSARQPFLPPAPPPPPQPVARERPAERPPPPPPPPPPPAYGEWRLVGVIDRISSDPEAMVTNTRTNETRRLKLGEAVLGVRFIGPGVDANRPGRAIFEREGVRLELRVGQTLGEPGGAVG